MPIAKSVNDQIEKMSKRERILLIVTIFAVGGMCLDMAFLKPIEDKKKKINTKITSMQQQMSEFNQRLASVGGGSSQEGDLSEFGDLKTKDQEISTQLNRYITQLPKSEDSMALVRQLLRPDIDDVSVLTLQSVSPSMVKSNVAEIAGNKQWYKHGLVISLGGAMSGLISYLTDLEQAAWQVMWESLHVEKLSSDRYQLTFEIYTVSEQKQWLQLKQ